MNRKMLAIGLLAVAVASVLLAQRLSRDRQFGALLAAGERALDAGDPYAAVESFSGAIAIRPDSMIGYFRRGEAYRAQHRDDAAIRDLREAARLAPDATQPLIALGDIYDGQREAARAAEVYGQAAQQLQDQNPRLLYKLALARYRAGSPASAVDPLRRAIARDDSIGEAHYLLGVLYRDMQDVDRAAASLERAVKVAPGLLAAREELADLYRTQRRWPEQLRLLQELAAQDPRVERTVAVGLAQADRREYDAALASLSSASARAPENPRVQLALARVYLARAGETPDREAVARATAAVSRVLAGAPRTSAGLALLGRASFLSGDYAASDRALHEAIASTPVAPEAYGYLADTAERIGHTIDARDALVALDTLEGDTTPADERTRRALRIGALSLRASDPKTAVRFLDRATGGGQGDGPTFGLLAQARWQSGDNAGAKAALSRGLELDPRNGELLRLTRTIK